ncbi:MAG: hypothetical protein IT260_23305 [Saprospiraceae bacterium]|nr:hypothetical protein [Saprospiraceae bacterium]
MTLLPTITQLLRFRLDRDAMLGFTPRHFLAGLLGTWIVGMGRYWDDPGASLLQHLGLGSVIYIFALSALIWLMVLPFRVEGWRYDRVLTFVSLTSFPAALYAIPVERFVPMKVAIEMNVWFLAVVALWRLALLLYFLRVFTRLRFFDIVTLTLLPVCGIIAALTALNLHRVVFDTMGGLHEPSAHDGAYLVLFFLTLIASVLVIPLLIAYGVGIYLRRKQHTSGNSERGG